MMYEKDFSDGYLTVEYEDRYVPEYYNKTTPQTNVSSVPKRVINWM